MDNKSKILIITISFSIVLIIFIILFGIIGLKYFSVFGEKFNKDSIISEYKKNNILFENSIKEIMKEENDIYFNALGNDFSIKVYKRDIKSSNNTTIEQIKEDDYGKYHNTLKLIKTLNLQYIKKDYMNIQFQLDSSMRWAKYISYITDKDEYIKNNNIVILEKINGNWYYVETN